MKRIAMKMLGIILISSSTLSAQHGRISASAPVVESSKAVEPGTRIINLGVGLGTSYYRYSRGNGYTFRSTPSLNLSYEQVLSKPVGPGLLGLGAFLGYQRTVSRYDQYYYQNNRYYYEHTWSHTFLAFRGAYHPDALIFEKGEVYFGAALGLRISNYSYYNSSPDPDKNRYRVSEGRVYPGASVFAGGRYFFTNSFGMFVELGYGINYLNLGLSLKF